VGFETTILVLERAKTVHVLDRAATVIGGHKIAAVAKAEGNRPLTIRKRSWKDNIKMGLKEIE
jgi:hypothetical protein